MNDKLRTKFENAGADLESALNVADLEVGDKVVVKRVETHEVIVDEVEKVTDMMGVDAHLKEFGKIGEGMHDYQPGQDEIPVAVPYGGD